MKIAYLSVSPLINSGYGRCCREVVYGLAEKHDIDVFAYYGLQKCSIDVDLSGNEGDRSVKIIGGDGTIYHPVLPRVQDQYDVIVAHYDMWMATFNPQWLDEITRPVVWWAVVDHEPLPHPVRRLLSHPCLLRAVPMTNWARGLLREYCSKELDPEIVTFTIPHGVDPSVFYPDPGFEVLDAEFNIVSVVANHGPRENIPTMLEGFALFLKNTEADAKYYLQTDVARPGGYNLIEIIKSIEDLYGVDLSNRVLFPNGPVDDDTLRKIYSSADCQLMCVMGGSFELPVLEAGACKTPSIVGAFSAPAELVGVIERCRCHKLIEGKRGLAVAPSAWVWMNLSSAKQAQYHPKDIAKALETYYFNPKLRKKHAEAMFEFAKELTWNKVREMWLLLMDELEGVL